MHRSKKVLRDHLVRAAMGGDRKPDAAFCNRLAELFGE
jgi:hypothetical protein